MEGVAEGEEALGFADVQADLGAEGFGGWEALLGAEMVEEGEFQRGGLGEGDGFEVEEVGFYSEGISAEGGAIAGIGDAAETA